jgi:hypothetical protein
MCASDLETAVEQLRAEHKARGRGPETRSSKRMRYRVPGYHCIAKNCIAKRCNGKSPAPGSSISLEKRMQPHRGTSPSRHAKALLPEIVRGDDPPDVVRALFRLDGRGDPQGLCFTFSATIPRSASPSCAASFPRNQRTSGAGVRPCKLASSGHTR